MKRTYKKPLLLKERFDIESQIAGCVIINNDASLYEQCSYEPDGLGYYIFAESWSSCIDQKFADDNVIYCYHAGVNNLFNS